MLPLNFRPNNINLYFPCYIIKTRGPKMYSKPYYLWITLYYFFEYSFLYHTIWETIDWTSWVTYDPEL